MFFAFVPILCLSHPPGHKDAPRLCELGQSHRPRPTHHLSAPTRQHPGPWRQFYRSKGGLFQG